MVAHTDEPNLQRKLFKLEMKVDHDNYNFCAFNLESNHPTEDFIRRCRDLSYFHPCVGARNLGQGLKRPMKVVISTQNQIWYRTAAKFPKRVGL